uniref:Nucleotidyl transferase domain-containing protein n=1 Tax=mine drainage metagenome TaxID=410659 RepID=E6PYK6_9ZZZZ
MAGNGQTMTQPTLLVLAAGMGSRYGGLKQIDPVGPHGEAIMDYSIYDAMRAGFGKVVFIIRKSIEEAFRESVGARFEGRIPVEYVFQELDQLPAGFAAPAERTKPWGTTQAVLSAAGAIHEPFAVINADDFYGAESYRVLAEHLQSGSAEYAMVGFVLRKTLSAFGSVARGVCAVDEGGLLKTVVELTKIEPDRTDLDGGGAKNTDGAGVVTRLSGDELVSMNMWGFTPEVFEQLDGIFESFLRDSAGNLKAECYLPNSVNHLVEQGKARVRVLSSPDSWFGVTYREDRASVVASIGELIRAGRYPERLWA